MKDSATTYTGDHLNEIAFPLGGIGSGCICLSGRGELVDWEIFNRPNKNYRPRHTFLSLWMKGQSAEPVFRVLESRLPASFSRHHTRYDITGAAPWYGASAGLPRMKSNTFTSAFPYARLDFEDDQVPLQVSLEAFNPFIPLDDFHSSLPAAFFYVILKNPAKQDYEATVAFNLENITGQPHRETDVPESPPPESGLCRNSLRQNDSQSWILLENDFFPQDSYRFGNLALGTDWPHVTHQVPWYRGGWWDGLQHFCNTFVKTGKFDDNNDSSPSEKNSPDIVSLGLKVKLAPGETVRLPFVLSWYFPLFRKYWSSPGKECRAAWENYYASRFENAGHVVKYSLENKQYLDEQSRKFSEAFYGSSLPKSVIETAANNLSILKTPTCIRLEDGSFYGFEGCCGNSGCCEGTCTHVWNYAQALPHLFPSLERSLRENELKYSVRESDGHMQFRMPLPPGSECSHDFHAAADGQLGTVLRVYRDYLFSGDRDWLGRMWPRTKKILEYAWKIWDENKEGQISGLHHNTYDIEFIGAEPLACTFYLAALRAAEEMAVIMNEPEKAKEYRRIFKSGSEKMDKLLFNGEYYFQKISDPDEKKYQFGDGCLSDQLIGQWYADMLDLGNLLNPDHIRAALKSIFRYNWKWDFSNFINPQRVYVMNDEQGLILCSWPRGKRPRFPFPYSDEVWYGVEYQVACEMIYRGLTDEALKIIEGGRKRHNGKNRNPWNEVECGNHYARSLASYSLVPVLSGILYFAPEKKLRFAPRLDVDHSRFFFCINRGWGVISRRTENQKNVLSIEMISGSLEIAVIELSEDLVTENAEIRINDMECEAKKNKNKMMEITLPEPVLALPEEPVEIYNIER